MTHSIGNSAFTFAGQSPAGNLTPAVEGKALSAAQRAFASGGDTETAATVRIGTPLEQSEWVLACVRLVANPLCSVPLQWWNSADPSEREKLDPDPLRANFWHSPSCDDFGPLDLDNVVFALAAWLALDGEAFIILPDEWLVRRSGSKLPPFIVAGRDEMLPQFSRYRDGLTRELLGWRFVAPGVNAELIPDQVIRLAVTNPGNRSRGLGGWPSASLSANADLAAAKYARNVAASNGGQSEYIVTDGGLPSPEQQAQIEAALRDKKRRAERGDFAPVFLGASLKVQSPSDRAVGSALAAQREGNRESIAAAFQVPLSMLQRVSGSSLGEGRVESEQRQLITGPCAPIARRIGSGFSTVEQRRTRRAAFASFDLDDHPSMRAARLAQAETAKVFVEMGFSLEEVNRNLSLGFDTMAETPQSAPPNVGGALPGGTAEPVQDAVAVELAAAKQLFAAFTAKQLTIAPKAEGIQGTIEKAAAPTPTESIGAAVTPEEVPLPVLLGQRKPGTRDKARIAKWQSYQKARKPFETRIKAAAAAVYKSATAEALATLTENLPEAKSAFDAAMPVRALLGVECKALSFAAISVANLGDALAKKILPIIVEAYAAGTTEAAAELRSLGIDPVTPPEVGAFLQVRENMIRDSSNATFSRLMGSLNAGFDKGETMAELAGRAKSVFHDATDAQATTIAVTETSAAFSTARQAQQEAAGVTFKEWLASGDDRVRATHAEIDGLVMPSDQPFMVGGAELMHPCAEGGPAEEVINCRCIAIAVSEEEGAAKYAAQTPKEGGAQ